MAARKDEGVTSRTVRRGRGAGLGEPVPDAVAVEEPLEIRVAGEPLAVTMRTPGHDRELALGFLFAEGLVASLADVGTVAHCGTPGEEGFGNVLDVTPGPGVAFDLDRLGASRRGTLTTAACGVCGRRSVADLLARCGPVPEGPPLRTETLLAGVEALAATQSAFARTGAVHGAAALDASGRLLAAMEDVGRHNAVDAVVGRLLMDGALPLPDPAAPGAPAILAVSGRVSFEIVQKAVVARLGAVAAVGAPTSLAVDLAERTGVLLAGFVRGGGLNVYTHPGRLQQ